MNLGSKFNWNQTGMPVSLVKRLGTRNEFAEFKSVLNDAGDRVLRPVDAGKLAQELVETGGRDLVEMVRELTTALKNAENELENANRRYERLVADLARRGIALPEDAPPPPEPAAREDEAPPDPPRREPKSIMDSLEEWESWNRKFQSLLG